MGLPSIMSMEEFDAQVAWPGDQSSSSRRGGASVSQEPMTEEPPAPAPSPAAVEEEIMSGSKAYMNPMNLSTILALDANT